MNARGHLPRAHGAHPGSPLEWWYLTGVLEDGAGYRMGFQVTFFRARIDAPSDGVEKAGAQRNAWQPGDVYFAHYAISDLKARFYRFDERIGRTSVALAGADSTDLNVWIRDWSLRRLPTGAFRLHAAGDLGELSLDLTPSRNEPIAWGRSISRPRTPRGPPSPGTTATPACARRARTPRRERPRRVRGTVWYDHEWSSGAYDSTLAGWTGSACV
jgi:predicted secreted hydrolase